MHAAAPRYTIFILYIRGNYRVHIHNMCVCTVVLSSSLVRYKPIVMAARTTHDFYTLLCSELVHRAVYTTQKLYITAAAQRGR